MSLVWTKCIEFGSMKMGKGYAIKEEYSELRPRSSDICHGRAE